MTWILRYLSLLSVPQVKIHMLQCKAKCSSFVQQLSICPSIHPSASAYLYTKIKPAKQIRYLFVQTIMICGSISPFNSLECIYRILLSSQILLSAVSIQHSLFCFLISLLVCFCLSYKALTASPYQILYFFFFFLNTLCLLLILLSTTQPYLATLGIVTFILL